MRLAEVDSTSVLVRTIALGKFFVFEASRHLGSWSAAVSALRLAAIRVDTGDAVRSK